MTPEGRPGFAYRFALASDRRLLNRRIGKTESDGAEPDHRGQRSGHEK